MSRPAEFGSPEYWKRVEEILHWNDPTDKTVKGLNGFVVNKLLPEIRKRALRPEEEGADLQYPISGRAQAVIKLRAIQFLSLDHLQSLLHHELMHLRDLMDAEFAYNPDSLAGIPRHRRRLVQERYRIAWAASVDGRLSRQGNRPLWDRSAHLEEIARSLPLLPKKELERLLEALWEGDRPTHALLMSVASAAADGARLPGAPCPLCGFPTHRWGDRFEEGLIDLISRDFPEWRPEDGACERCLDGYQTSFQGMAAEGEENYGAFQT